MSPFVHTEQENPGSDSRRAGARHFQLAQSYDQNTYFTMATQA
jgi:hypothetical protein